MTGKSNHLRPGWSHLLGQWQRDAVAWLALMALLTAYRVWLAGPHLADVGLAQGLHALWTGARFDSVLATLVVIPTLALAWVASVMGLALPVDRMRLVLLAAALVVTGLLYAANAEFVRVLGTQLDQRALAVLYDPDGAVRTMIWQAHSPVARAAAGLAGAGLALAAIAWLVRRVPHTVHTTHGPLVRWLAPVLLLVLVVGLVRGFSWSVSPIRIRNAHVSASVELNRVIPSPWAFLLFSLEDQSRALATPQGDELARALQTHELAAGLPPGQGLDIAARLQRQAPGATAQPRHVFVLVLEGQHGFPLLQEYRRWGLYPGLARLADQGAWFDRFVPSGRQTDNTLGVLVAGTLTPDLVVLMDPGAHRELPTSTAPHFRRLGYTTRFFYGGYAGWGRLDEFVLGQGFERLHTASELPAAPGNAWGVWDAHLLDHVLATVDASQPSFNVILTTNNHSPFDLPESLLPPLPVLPAQAPAWDTMTRRVLQHEMYVDREVSRFVDAASRRFPGALFVITGDHQAYAARYTLPQADPLHPMTVPLIFTGAGLPAHLRGRHSHPASHLDITPTLYSLLAPAGFAYRSMGADLFAPRPAAHALGQDKVLVNAGLASAAMPAPPAPGQPPPPAAADVELARRHHAAVRTVSRAMLRSPGAGATASR